jgi:hypothetical protein
MNGEMFVRMATAVLGQMGDQAAGQKAEAIAQQMDMFAAVLGETPAPIAPAARPAFPALNPEAVSPIVTPPPVPKFDGPPLIISATTIPDRPKIERANPPPPPAARMKVEDLNLIIQERTPKSLIIDYAREDGTTGKARLVRDVLSMHAFDSVKLIYYPENATSSERELTQVHYDLHVDDVPFDLNVIIVKIKQQASLALAPRHIPQSLAPRPTSGPVTHNEDTYKDPSIVGVQNQFNSMPSE